MSFSKFKLEKVRERATPAPIAAALPQLAPTKTNVSPGLDHSLDLSAFAGDAHKSNTRDHRIQNGLLDWSSEPASLQRHLRRSSSACAPNHKRRRLMNQNEAHFACQSPQSVSHGKKSQQKETQLERMAIHTPPENGRTTLRENKTGSDKHANAHHSAAHRETGTSHAQSPPCWEHRIGSIIDSHFCPKSMEQKFDHYTGNLMPTCPVVIFPPETTAEYARKTRPLLFLAIASIAPVGAGTPDHHKHFAIEARTFLIELAILEGEKSLELIQALLVASFWYRAHKNYARSNQNQLASIALSIAIDIGLDRVQESSTPRTMDEKWSLAEAQRTWLGCFLLCSSLSLIMRRPSPIRWTIQLDKYLDHLTKSRVSPTDPFLCSLLRTEKLCHFADDELYLSEPAKSVSLWEPKTLDIVQTTKTQSDEITIDPHNRLEKALLSFGKLASSLYAHELALHVNHNIDEFKAPFSENSLKSFDFLETQTSNEACLPILRIVVLAAHGLLDSFMELSTSEILALPPHIYAGRVIYAMVLLIKLHKAISTSMHELDDGISLAQLHLEAYIERLFLTAKRLRAEDGSNSLTRALLIVPQLKKWLSDHSSTSEFEKDGTAHKASLAGDCADSMPANHNPEEFPQSLPHGVDGQPPILSPSSNVLGTPTYQYGNTSTQDDVSGREKGMFNRDLVSDSWFWEFFNVNMLD